jgi:uncharacterized protein (DUF2235 family)
VRLSAVAIKDPASQIVYCGPGLGTLEATSALTWAGRALTRPAGLAFGYGIARDIANAYAFIMAHYQPDDRLYLFGFSRGAYTARAVASLLRLYGLLRVNLFRCRFVPAGALVHESVLSRAGYDRPLPKEYRIER